MKNSLFETLFVTHKFKYPVYLGASFMKPFLLHMIILVWLRSLFVYYATICTMLTYVFRKLGCLAPVLTPTLPIVWLGCKGSTSAIFTTGSSELWPQTGWSRKLALLLFSIMVGTQQNSWVQKIYCTSVIVTMSNRRKVSVGVLFSSKMLLTLRQ